MKHARGPRFTHEDIERMEADAEMPKDIHDSLMLANLAHLLIDLLETAKQIDGRLDAAVQLLARGHDADIGAA